MDLMTPGVRTAAFLLSEANGERSREQIVIPAGQGRLPAGSLLTADNEKADDVTEAVKVLYGAVDATDEAVKATAVSLDAEVHGELLAWDEDATSDQKLLAAQALLGSGIVVRWTERPVASGDAHHLEFMDIPSTGVAGAPAGRVQVYVRDVFGALVNGSGISVTLAKATGPGTIANAGAVNAVNGVATWEGVTFSAAGTYTLNASATGLTAAISGDVVIAAE